MYTHKKGIRARSVQGDPGRVGPGERLLDTLLYIIIIVIIMVIIITYDYYYYDEVYYY